MLKGTPIPLHENIRGKYTLAVDGGECRGNFVSGYNLKSPNEHEAG
jgi:hypothetical protein